jgi:hypothetical protein
MIRHEAQALPNNHQVLLYQGGAAARRRWPGASAAALPWRYRARPSGSSSLGDSRPAVLSHPVGMNAVVVNVPDVTLDPGDPCGHQARNQGPRRQHARTGRGPSPARCRQLSVFTGVCTERRIE